MVTAEFVLCKEDLKLLTHGQQLVQQSQWDRLWQEIRSFSPYAVFVLLQQMRNQSNEIMHEKLSRLLHQCYALPADFEELGRPIKELVPLNLNSNLFAIYPLDGGDKAILEQSDGLKIVATEPFLQSAMVQTARHQNKPYILQRNEPVLSPSGRYYALRKEERFMLYSGADGQALLSPTFFKRGANLGFISDNEVLISGPWFEYYNGYWSTTPIKKPDAKVYNIETGASADFFVDAEAILSPSSNVADFSRNRRYVAFTELEQAPSNANVQRGRTYIIDRQTSKRIFETPFDRIDRNRADRVFFCANDQLLAIANSASIEFWSIASKIVVSCVQLRQPEDNFSIAFDRHRDLFAFESNGQLIVMSARSLSPSAILPGQNTSLVFLKNYLLARGTHGWVAYASGGRMRNWEHALYLRRASVQPLHSIDQSIKQRIHQLAQNEGWLSRPQHRWLHSVSALFKCVQG